MLGICAGFTQLDKNDVFWAKPMFRKKVWWLDSASGCMFDGDQRLTESKQNQPGQDDHARHRGEGGGTTPRTPGTGMRQKFDVDDVLTCCLDLGFSETAGGKFTVRVNGNHLTFCEGVVGPVRLAVQLMNKVTLIVV